MQTTIDSSAMSDLIWMYFSIFNVYQVKYLPVLHKNQDETLQDFSERIREVSLGIFVIKKSLHNLMFLNEQNLTIVYL